MKIETFVRQDLLLNYGFTFLGTGYGGVVETYSFENIELVSNNKGYQAYIQTDKALDIWRKNIQYESDLIELLESYSKK